MTRTMNIWFGCTGRTTYSQCLYCKAYHKIGIKCPEKAYRYLYSKWKHSGGFKSTKTLYNLWFAKKVIKKTGVVILVESPGNVWRLEEAGIHNSLGIFGCEFSDEQKEFLDKTGAMTIIALLDNDEAGQLGIESIYNKCWKDYKIVTPTISKNDIGDMTIEEVKNITELQEFINV